MASALKNLSQYDAENIPSAKGMTFAIAVSEWNRDITFKLFEGCMETLIRHGAREADIHAVIVPGTFELPTAARMLFRKLNPDAVICIGCVIKGETQHDEYINHACAQALAHLGATTGKPFIFGVLTPNNHDQAADRAGGKYGNKGVEAAVTAIRMATLNKELA
ncbi:MAG: 6,7-dimethyl-8-ribityllumazine synthase [Bacteroidetes bacterium]|nr:MAG: 6,7-dimethyl-8-ribityllumazine synthase [Bacteroidota bacterium]